jgi:polysaccharide export outer membrane protein
MVKHIAILLLLAISLLSTSCKLREKTIYFQGTSTDSTLTNVNYTPIFKSDDFLAIVVYGDDPESVVPFNLTATTTNSTLSGYESGVASTTGYLIDANGDVNMPIIGKVHISGLNRMEATELIQSKLKDYIKNPIVSIQIQNYKVTVLGDVRNPGTFKIPNERITLIEAIGLAGDLSITGSRKNVLVIRDSNGTKTEYRVDLTKKDFFQSPVYYLTQNDVVYVEPSMVKRTEATLWRTSGPVLITLTSLILTTITLITTK